jgi:hypothetical protein
MMKTRIFDHSPDMATFVICALILLGGVAHASSTRTYNVTVNTSPLVGHPAAPFSIFFGFIDGTGLGNANNTATVAGFDFGGGSTLGAPVLLGGASGDLVNGVTITDSSFLNLFSETFTPGSTLRFTMSITSADNGDIPDRLTFFILDNFGNAIPTQSPTADFLAGIDLVSSGAAPESFGADTTRSPSSGNPIAIAAPVIASTDKTAPITTAALTPAANANGWVNADVTVTLTGTDNEPGGTGVEQINFSATGAQPLANTAVQGTLASFTVTTEGVTTVSFFGTDFASNTETLNNLTIQLDKTVPTISGMPAAGCTLSATGKFVQIAVVSGADALSGLASFDVSVSSSQASDDANEPDIVVTGSGLQPRTVQVRAKIRKGATSRTYTVNATVVDVAGNAVNSSSTCTVTSSH